MSILGLTTKRAFSLVICAAAIVTVRGAVATDNTAEEIVKQYANVDSAEIDRLVVELGHGESSHRKAALDQATHLTAQSLATLVAKLKTSGDPELIAASKTLEPALAAAGFVMSRSTVEVIRRAIDGDARSQGILASMFANCDGGLTRNPAEALRWAGTSADHDSAIGQYNLARLYDEGCGIAVDTNKAKELFIKCSKELKKMAQKGDAEAQCDLGWLCDQGKGVQTNREEAMKWYQKAAEQGHPRAQYYLGCAYTNGVGGLPSDKVKAFEFCARAAEQECAAAEFYVASAYESGDGPGEGGASDHILATNWYTKAAEHGYLAAQNRLGVLCVNSSDESLWTIGFKWLSGAANQGDPDAQASLGSAYERGRGVETNRAEALKWYRKAAEQGNPGNQWLLGWKFYYGRGVETNFTEAVYWYRKAAEQGFVVAQRDLGVMYQSGRGVETNYEEAVKWYRKAAEGGNMDAQNDIGVMCERGQGVETNCEEAVKWYRNAAEQGNAMAQSNLGLMYEQGKGVKTNWEEAVRWYCESAEHGNSVGQGCLGWMYDHGKGVETNYTEALKWYRKAAEQGNVNAQDNLGLMYQYGKGVETNNEEALMWYRKAIAGGSAAAQNDLGVMYALGNGVETNCEEAVKWYRKAAEGGNVVAQDNLGFMYAHGKGVETNYEEAVKWYRKAAEGGNVEASINMAIMYEFGLGVATNLARAIEFLEKGGEGGFNDLAWIYATASDPKFHNAKLSLEYALKSHAEPKYYLDTLAAAYARDGQFDKAIEAQSKAVELLDKAEGLEHLKKDYRKRLELYRKHEAYTEDGIDVVWW
jgi:uncharacterized protein